jgi:hypothetical protein
VADRNFGLVLILLVNGEFTSGLVAA